MEKIVILAVLSILILVLILSKPRSEGLGGGRGGGRGGRGWGGGRGRGGRGWGGRGWRGFHSYPQYLDLSPSYWDVPVRIYDPLEQTCENQALNRYQECTRRGGDRDMCQNILTQQLDVC